MTIYLSWPGLLPPAYFNATKSIITTCFSPTLTAVAANKNRKIKTNANFNFSFCQQRHKSIVRVLIVAHISFCFAAVELFFFSFSLKMCAYEKSATLKRMDEVKWILLLWARTYIIQLRLWKMIFNTVYPIRKSIYSVFWFLSCIAFGVSYFSISYIRLLIFFLFNFDGGAAYAREKERDFDWSTTISIKYTWNRYKQVKNKSHWTFKKHLQTMCTCRTLVENSFKKPRIHHLL